VCTYTTTRLNIYLEYTFGVSSFIGEYFYLYSTLEFLPDLKGIKIHYQFLHYFVPGITVLVISKMKFSLLNEDVFQVEMELNHAYDGIRNYFKFPSLSNPFIWPDSANEVRIDFTVLKGRSMSKPLIPCRAR